MAVTPKTNEAFLREVDEELRRDQLTTAWQRYGRIAIVAVLAALAAFAGALWWQHHREEQRGADAAQLQQAYDSLIAGRPQAAATPLAALADSSIPGYRSSARYAQADALLARNDLAGAARIFASVANDTSVGQPFRDLALIRQTSAEFDTLSPQAVISRLAPLRSPNAAFFGSAAEMTALAYLKMNRPREAGALFGQIARNTHVPRSLRQRAVQMAGSLGVDAVAQTEGNVVQ